MRVATQRAQNGSNSPLDDTSGPLLFSELAFTLHSDHLAVAHLIERLLATDSADDPELLWMELYSELSAHARAEQDTVYRDLLREPELQSHAEDAVDDHQLIHLLLDQLSDLDRSSAEFHSKLQDLDEAFLRHLADEERSLLPLAEEVCEIAVLDRLVEAFNARKKVILDKLRIERLAR